MPILFAAPIYQGLCIRYVAIKCSQTPIRGVCRQQPTLWPQYGGSAATSVLWRPRYGRGHVFMPLLSALETLIWKGLCRHVSTLWRRYGKVHKS